MRRPAIVMPAGAVAAVVLLAGCTAGDDERSGAASGAPTATATASATDDTLASAPAPIDLGAGASVALVELAEEIGFEAALSPDGSLVAYRGGEGICIAATDGSGTPRCAAFDAPVAVSLARFSPDGSQLTFAEEFARTLGEPDVWVLDVAEMTLANRTDDGVTDLDITGDGAPGADIDLATTWMPDGSLVFVRADGARGDSRLLRLGSSGDPQEVSDLAGFDPIEVVYPLVPVGDDAVLAVTSPVDGGARLARVDLTTGASTTLATLDDALGLVQIADVHGNLALLRSETVVGTGFDDRASHVLVDLDSGDQFPLFAPETSSDDADDASIQPAAALFTPDGTAVVYSRIGAPGALRAITVESILAGPTGDDIVELLEPFDDGTGDQTLWWNPQATMRWTADGELVGVVGTARIGTVTFGGGR